MMDAKHVVWLVAAAALTAGCQGVQDPLQPFTFETPHAFQTGVQFSPTGTSNSTLSGPHDIPLRDGAPFAAYALNVSWSSDNPGMFNEPEGWIIWYLDADMRIVAIELGCRAVFGGCDRYVEWDWRRMGHIGPNGLGYPDLAARNLLTSFGNHQIIDHHWEAKLLPNGTLHLVVQGGHPFLIHGDVQAEYFYQPGRMLPDGPENQVLAYVAGPPLDPADSLAVARESPEPRPWTGALFPGEDNPAFTVGVAHREILDFAFPGFDASTSCVLDYDLRIYSNSPTMDWPLTPVPDLTPHRTGFATITALLPDAVRWVQVDIMWDPVRNEARMEQTAAGPGAPSLLSCQDIQRAPFPALTPDEARRFAEAKLSQAGSIVGFQHRVPVPDMVEGQEPWHEWKFEFQPKWLEEGHIGFYAYYAMELEPFDPPLLLWIKAHPQDY